MEPMAVVAALFADVAPPWTRGGLTSDPMVQGFAFGVAGSLAVVAILFALRGKKPTPAAVAPPPPPKPLPPPPPPKPTGAPLRALALLQAEARLVDFLMEDLTNAKDDQIGQAVREIQHKARAALLQHANPEPILAGTEGDTVTVPAGFDPSAVRVVGNVSGPPPFTGTLQHPGWRVKSLKLAAPPEGADEFVLQPAEVQVG